MRDDPGHPPGGGRACTCKPPPEADGSRGRRPGRAVVTGFEWHDPTCPAVPGAVLSPEAQARLTARLAEIDACQRRAMEGAMTYVIG